MARPIPRPDPVTNATRFLSSIGVSRIAAAIPGAQIVVQHDQRVIRARASTRVVTGRWPNSVRPIRCIACSLRIRLEHLRGSAESDLRFEPNRSSENSRVVFNSEYGTFS